MTGDIVNEIRSRYNQFTKAEKRVADYVLQNLDKVVYMSIIDLAEASNVGDTSVFRFCKKVGVQGYQEFKMALSLSANNEARKLIDVTDHDDFYLMTQKILQSYNASLDAANSSIDREKYECAVDYLAKAKNIYFFGAGLSGITALDAFNKFLRITPNVRYTTDLHMQTMLASMLSSEDVAVIFSYSGSTKDIVKIADLVKQTGCKIICITRFKKSPLTGFADITLLCGGDENPLEGGSITAKISQLYIVDLLYSGYYKANEKQSKENREKTSKAVVEKLY
ncbi:MAG: MurR/RpiR family transcriptional regulator [Clostridiaceae bacterium]|nr:MurR/RpiR family transcriptional regulator [Clostridiaceae bacterium]